MEDLNDALERANAEARERRQQAIIAALEVALMAARNFELDSFAVYTPDDCGELTSTSKDAVNACEPYVEADGEWCWDAHEVHWGVYVRVEQCVEENRREDPDGNYDYLAEYVMRPLIEPATPAEGGA